MSCKVCNDTGVVPCRNCNGNGCPLCGGSRSTLEFRRSKPTCRCPACGGSSFSSQQLNPKRSESLNVRVYQANLDEPAWAQNLRAKAYRSALLHDQLVIQIYGFVNKYYPGTLKLDVVSWPIKEVKILGNEMRVALTHGDTVMLDPAGVSIIGGDNGKPLHSESQRILKLFQQAWPNAQTKFNL